MQMAKKIGAFFGLAGCSLVAWAVEGSGLPLALEWGRIDTGRADTQAAFHLWRASARAPAIQQESPRGTVPWLVQLNGPADGQWLAALENRGGILRGYIPENGYLVEAAPAAAAAIAAGAQVFWMGEYLPAYKKSPGVPEPVPGGAGEAREYRLKLFDVADKPRVVRDLGELGAVIPRASAFSESPLLRARLTPGQVDAAANGGAVEWIEPDPVPRSWGASRPPPETGGEPDGPAAVLQGLYAAGARVAGFTRGVADAGSYGLDAWEIDRFVWAHPDMLVVAAAGNAAVDLKPADGVADAGSVGTPATAKNVLAVGAAEGCRDLPRTWRDSWPEDFAVEPIALDRMAQTDGPQGLAAFSGRGPCADGRLKPDLVAPGTFVPVSRPADSAFTGWGETGNPGEIYVGGTGVAAEQVAAAAEQARQWLVDARDMSAPSAALVKALLIAGARDLAPGQYGTGAKQEIPGVRPNGAQGFGLLDLANALEADEGETIELHESPGLVSGAGDVYEVSVGQPGGRFILVLAYADAPAAPAAACKRVNDLDLSVRKPSGEVVHPNGRIQPDGLNNVEMIEFEADEAGVYLARVEARAVPMGGTQPYALVVRRPRTSTAPAAALETP